MQSGLKDVVRRKGDIVRRIEKALVLILMGSLGSMVWAGDGEPSEIDLITHAEVWIERPAEVIWPRILDASEWKKLATTSLHAGTKDTVGEVRLVRGGEGDGAYEFFMETVALQTARHKVVKIYPEDRSHLGFAAWRLFNIGGRTLVTYDVYSEMAFPDVAPDQAGAFQDHYTEMNQTRFESELQLLKKIVEEIK